MGKTFQRAVDGAKRQAIPHKAITFEQTGRNSSKSVRAFPLQNSILTDMYRAAHNIWAIRVVTRRLYAFAS